LLNSLDVSEKSYFNDSDKENDSVEIMPLNAQIPLRSLVMATSNTRELAPFGAVTVGVRVYRYIIPQSRSSIYILKSSVTFTPGQALRNQGRTEFINWENLSGNVSINLEQVVDYIWDLSEWRFGGVPLVHDVFPVANPTNITLRSMLTPGVEMGRSMITGFMPVGLAGQPHYTNIDLDRVVRFNKNFLSNVTMTNSQSTWHYSLPQMTPNQFTFEPGVVFEMTNYSERMPDDFYVNFVGTMRLRRQSGSGIFGNNPQFSYENVNFNLRFRSRWNNS